MYQVTCRQPHKCTLIRKLSLTNHAECQLGDEKAFRLAMHASFLLLQILSIIESLEDLHFSLLLQLVVQCNLEEVFETKQGNVVGQDLERVG